MALITWHLALAHGASIRSNTECLTYVQSGIFQICSNVQTCHAYPTIHDTTTLNLNVGLEYKNISCFTDPVNGVMDERQSLSLFHVEISIEVCTCWNSSWKLLSLFQQLIMVQAYFIFCVHWLWLMNLSTPLEYTHTEKVVFDGLGTA